MKAFFIPRVHWLRNSVTIAISIYEIVRPTPNIINRNYAEISACPKATASVFGISDSVEKSSATLSVDTNFSLMLPVTESFITYLCLISICFHLLKWLATLPVAVSANWVLLWNTTVDDCITSNTSASLHNHSMVLDASDRATYFDFVELKVTRFWRWLDA